MTAARRLRDRLAERATQDFVGRTAELALLLDTGCPVVHVHGIGGIGKSRLLDAFAAAARARDTVVVRLDCRVIEPTERGFLDALGAAIGREVASADQVAERLGALGGRVALTLDHYEVFRLLDTWLRQVFVPSLGEEVRLLCFGREAPAAAWVTAPGWRGLHRSLALGPLDERAALALLTRDGFGEADARRINRFARGHPLALILAASAASERPDLDLGEVGSGRVVEELTRLYLADIRDPLTRQALDAASVVRRTTLSLLRAMLPDAAPQDAFERLRALPFMMTRSDGLIMHDSVQQAVAAALRAADPGTYRDYRRAAWAQLRAEVRTAGRAEFWRYTVDMLYILENPAVREAFFPSDPHALSVEPARPGDGPAIAAIIARHEGPEAARLLLSWWSAAPDAFAVARDGEGAIAGFYILFDPHLVGAAQLKDDPVTRTWMAHLRRDPVARGQQILFCRGWLSSAVGELPSPAQAASWLDIKRSYMELRPRLRRVYLAMRELPIYGPIVQQLGFRLLPEAAVTLDGVVYHTTMLDLGAASVDGWLGHLVAGELGLEEDSPLALDRAAREVVLGDRRVGLTRLEYATLDYLSARPGKAVSRADLLADVWGSGYAGGSNVVDAVVRSLRKKLGDRAGHLETVSGIGYRLRLS